MPDHSERRGTSRRPILMNVVEIAVIAGAAAVMFGFYGMGFVCPLGGFLVLGWIFLRIFASFWREPLRRRKISLVLVTVFAGLAVAHTIWQTRPETLFRAYIADTVPQSVCILHSEYQGGRDYAAYLHFKVSPQDMKQILQSRGYTLSESLNGPIGSAPDWWSPRSLANPRMYVWPAEENGSDEKAWLWVNEENTEVYFTYWTF